ncbi:MAG: LPS export ABC transporter periplasmic protein LptC [Proteobacteria bacterium]|nr:LPS export ABC transporter periplasmic protein LptC [Pseudomonadota bacterium]
MIGTGRSSRFETYAPRRLHAFGRGYSVFVRVLKLLLPLVALVIIGILVARLTEGPQQKITALPSEEKTTPGQIELVQPKYEGVDDQGRPYTVTADKAVRAMDSPDTVLFDNPLADILLRDRTWVAVKAAAGFFDHKAEILHLTKEVTVFHDSGYQISLHDLEINLKQKTAATALPILAQGPMGMIEASNMVVKDQGDLIIFGGPATLTVFHLTVSRKGHG